jgi:transglutaminase-like putative cysteine protease
MMNAPTPMLNARTIPTPSGAAGVYHTLRVMREAVATSKVDPALIQTATGIIFLTPEKNELSEVTAIFEWVRDHVRYVRDPHGVESVTDPRMTVRRMVGDCDDQTALLCALFEAVGYPTRFVMGAYSVPGNFEHVYCQVFAGDSWINCDPTERQPLGYAPPDPVSLYFEG